MKQNSLTYFKIFQMKSFSGFLKPLDKIFMKENPF